MRVRYAVISARAHILNSFPEPSFYYDFADAALVMLDAADLPEDQEVITVKDFCRCVEAKGVSPDRLLPARRARHAACCRASTPSLPPPRSVRLVLQNFFECIHSARSDSESSDADHKPHGSFAAAMEAADARSMEKFAHVAEKFMHKSVVAAIAPFKEAVMRFALLQADTVREGVRGLWCFRRVLFCVRACVLACVADGMHPTRFASELPRVAPQTPASTPCCSRHPSFAPNLATDSSAGQQQQQPPRSNCRRAAQTLLRQRALFFAVAALDPLPCRPTFLLRSNKSFLHFLTRLQWRLRPQLAISFC